MLHNEIGGKRVLFALLVVPIILFLWVVSAQNYYPFYFDEAIYLTGGKLFYETWSMKAVMIFDEKRSILGGFGWYGPMYNALYGLLPKILGWSPASNLWLHLAIYVILLYFLRYSKLLQSLNNNVLLLGFLSSYAVVPFLFSYFPELLHVLFGLLFFVFFFRAHQSRESFRFFVLLVFIFSLFRVTFIFGLLAITPVKVEQVTNLRKYMVLGLFFVFGLLYYKFFHATPSVVGLADAFSFDLRNASNITKTVKTNLHSNILLFLSYFKIWPKGFDSLLACLFLGILTVRSTVINKGIKMRQLMGILIIAFLLVMFLFTFYSVKPFFLEKQLSWLYTVLLLLVIQEKVYNKLLVWVWLSFFLPFTVHRVYDTIQKRTFSAQITQSQKESLPNLEDILAQVPINKEINILFAYNEYPVISNLAYSFFPLSVKGKPILYTSNLCFNQPECKYKEHGIAKLDFILANEKLSMSNWALFKEFSEGFYLYKKVK